jgi:hypothetical protein
LEKKMGEVIVFRPAKDGTHLRPPPEGTAKIVTFIGGWHAPMNDREGRRALGFIKAVWHEHCRRKFSCSFGPLWPLITASLRGAGMRPGTVVQVTRSARRMIPGEAKRGGASS